MHAALLATFLSLPAGAATASKDAPAPEVMGLSIDNRPLRLSEFKGEVVVLSFWATWCPPCLEDLDALAREDAALRAEGIRILAVNVDQQHERDAVGALAEAHGWAFPILFDPTRRALGAYFSTRSIPVTAIIDPEGILKELHLSWDEGDSDQLLEEARSVRAERAGAPDLPQETVGAASASERSTNE